MNPTQMFLVETLCVLKELVDYIEENDIGTRLVDIGDGYVDEMPDDTLDNLVYKAKQLLGG